MNCWMQERRKRIRRRRVLRVLKGVVAFVSVTALAGLWLPIQHVAIVGGRFAPPQEAIWRVLTDLEGMPVWRSDLTRVERLPDVGGRPTWRESGHGGARIIEQVAAEPPALLVTHRLGSRGRPDLPQVTIELLRVGDGTEVTVTERREVRNPLLRVLVRLGLSRSAAERLLADLDRRLNVIRHQVAEGGEAHGQ